MRIFIWKRFFMQHFMTWQKRTGILYSKSGTDKEAIRRLVCAGGVNWKTPEIRQMLSQISKKECVLSPMADEALAGMYQLSLVCSGICRDLEESRAFILKI